MKVLLDIKDDKVPFILELLGNFKFVKVELLSANTAKIYKDLKQSFKEVKQIQSGKIKAQSLSAFLNEL